jgi:2-oxoisovalerate dehydrogenase E2 component (dihydrolipoyl transacylase)
LVREDQPIVDVMTDKATVEITSPVSGKVIARHGEIGAKAPVGGELVVFALDDGDAKVSETPAAAPTASAAGPSNTKPAPPVQTPLAAAATRASAPSARDAIGRPLAAPAVRAHGREAGVDLAFVQGTGPEGRITREDVDAYRAGGASSAPHGADLRRTAVEAVKVLGLRRQIAEKMSESKRRIPHAAYVEEIDVTELEELRQHLNATKAEALPKLTLLPFFIHALVKVLPQTPQLNAIYDDDAGIIHRHAAVHVGVAAQTPNGLMAPVVRHAEALDIWDIATEIARLSAGARAGGLSKAELAGSTITISSLGALGGVSSSPVVNWPEVAIMAPNRVVERPVVRQGAVAIRRMMNMSISFDHRVVDGYDAALFLQKLKGVLEHPGAIFVAR